MNKLNSTIRKKVQTEIKPLLSSVIRGVVIGILCPITILSLLLAIMTNIGFAQSFILMFGTCGSSDGEFDSPTDVVVDSTVNIYFADAGNDRIQVFAEVLDVGADGGCSVASVGSASSILLFLLIPAFIILRRVWRIYISRK